MVDKSNPFAAFMQRTSAPTAAEPVDPTPPTPVVDPTTAIVGPVLEGGEAKQFLTDLLTRVDEAVEEPAPTEIQGEIFSREQLAATDTSNLEPQKMPTTSLAKAVATRNAALTLDSASSVRELCDSVDKQMSENPNLAGPVLIVIRAHVVSLMVTLKSHSEFESVLIDKDIHNIMKFVRATREEALLLRDVKVDKKAKRGSTKEQKQIQQAPFANAFAAVMAKMGAVKK